MPQLLTDSRLNPVPSFSPEIKPQRKNRVKSRRIVLRKSTAGLAIAYTANHYPAPTATLSIPVSSAGQLLDPMRTDLKIGARIRQLATYRDGWFNPDSIGASPQAIQDAEKFVSLLDFRNLHNPYISLSEDGEINFWWNLPNFRLDLGIFGDGTYVYYARLSDGQEIAQDGVPINMPLPVEIMEQLQKQ